MAIAHAILEYHITDGKGNFMSMLTTSQKLRDRDLYDRDFYQWTQATANRLRQGQFADLDVANLIEEVESMGRSEKRELRSRAIVLLMHLLKWNYQPHRRSASWESTISEQRVAIEILLEDSPSLNPFWIQVLPACYQKAREKAAEETNMAIESFPTELPFAPQNILGSCYFP